MRIDTAPLKKPLRSTAMVFTTIAGVIILYAVNPLVMRTEDSGDVKTKRAFRSR